jgi:hypothetical protein
MSSASAASVAFTAQARLITPSRLMADGGCDLHFSKDSRLLFLFAG